MILQSKNEADEIQSAMLADYSGRVVFVTLSLTVDCLDDCWMPHLPLMVND